MNKLLMSLICVSTIGLSASAVRAQEGDLPPPPPAMETERPGRQDLAEKFAKDLGLSEEQKAQAEKIRQQGREKVEPLMKQMKDLREKMDELRKENMKEFENILTPEQKNKLDEIKDRHHKRMEERRRHPKGRKEHRGPRPEPRF